MKSTRYIYYAQIIIALGFAAWLGVWFAQADVFQWMPSYTTMTWVVALVMWLVASVSTCLALTGGIVIGYAQNVEDKNPRRTQWAFHLGRLAAFVVGGALLGLIGSVVASMWQIAWMLNMVIGILLILVGLSIFGVFPSVSRLGVVLPGWMSRPIFALKQPKYAPVVGALTFLIPCGFTQTMQLFAVQSAGPLQWAWLMGMFALGTLPVLLALGMGVSYVKTKLQALNPLIAIIIVAFGVMTVTLGYAALRAWSYDTGLDVEITADDVDISTREVVEVGHNGWQFEPAEIELAVWQNYRVRVTPTSDGIGCMYSMVYAGKEYFIREGDTFELLVNGSSPRNIPLVCGSMGMRQGMIVIK